MFPPRQRQRPNAPIIVDSDNETEDAFEQNGQNLLTDEEFEVPPTLPQRISPNQEDYLDRVEREVREREADEFAEQSLTPGYMRTLRDLFNQIDEWLSIGGGIAPFPEHFKRFVRHNWCVRLLPIEERIRISKLRLRFDLLIIEEKARKEAAFWESVEQNETNVRDLSPLCTICRFDLRNESFAVHRLDRCGHMFHKRCIERHLENNLNPKCPNCNAALFGPGARVVFNFQ